MNRFQSFASRRPGLHAAARAPNPVGASAPADTRGAGLLAVMIWVLIIYLIVPAAYLSGKTDIFADGTLGAPNPVARALKLTLLAAGVVIVLWRAGLAWIELRCVNPFFLLFLGLVPASILWSIDPTATANRFVSTMSIVMVAFAFTLMAWNRTRLQDVIRPVITWLIVASFLWGVFYPQYAIETGDGTLKDAWRGLTFQKNQFGMLASIGAVLWLHAGLSRERSWWWAMPMLSLSFACVLLSRSSTSLLATIFCLAFMFLSMGAPSNLRRYMPYIVSAFAVMVVVYALAILKIIPGIGVLLDPIAELAGKDLTFSNRAVIWGIIREHIELAPILGSGYGAYWTGPVPSSPSYVFLQRMYFYPTESHNGYLEIVNDLGFVGLIVLLGYLVFWVRQSLTLLVADRNQAMLFLAIFFQQAITNLSESTWLSINSGFAMAIGTLATFAMARSIVDQRLARVPAQYARPIQGRPLPARQELWRVRGSRRP